MIDLLDNEIFVLLDTISENIFVFAHIITNPFDYNTDVIIDFFKNLPEKQMTMAMENSKIIVFDYFIEFDSFEVFVFFPEKETHYLLSTKEETHFDETNETVLYLKDQELKRQMDCFFPKKYLQEIFYRARMKNRNDSDKKEKESLVVRFCYKNRTFFCNLIPENKILQFQTPSSSASAEKEKEKEKELNNINIHSTRYIFY